MSVQLKSPVTLSNSVQIIDLPTPGFEVPSNGKVETCGYGTAHPDGPTSTQLKKDHFYVINRHECSIYYQSVLGKSISNSQICAKSSPGYGTCQGDSGSPLIYKNKIVGVVSGGDGGCAEGNPDVYTKISSFIPFIKYELNYDFTTPEGANSPGKSLNEDDVADSPVLPNTEVDPTNDWSGAWETFPPQAFDPSLDPSWGTHDELFPSYPQYEPDSGTIQGSDSWYPVQGSNEVYPGFENAL